MLAGIRDVTAKDILRVLNQYIKPIFEGKESTIAITTNPSNLQTIVEGFGKLSLPRRLNSVSLEDFFADNKTDAKQSKPVNLLTLKYRNRTMKLKIRKGSVEEDILRAIRNRFELAKGQKLRVRNEKDQTESDINEHLFSGEYSVILTH